MKRFFLIAITLGFPALAAFNGLDNSNSPIEIDANREIICDESKQRCDAYGNATAQREDLRITADQLTAFFNEDTHEITQLIARGNARIHTPNEAATGASHGVYDAVSRRVTLTGPNLTLKTPQYTLSAKDFIEFDQNQDKATVSGEALILIIEKDQFITAESIVALFAKEGKKERLKVAEARGQVMIGSPDETLTGDRAVYDAAADRVDISGNVQLVRGESIVQGESGWMNLKTNHAELVRAPQSHERTHGLIYPKDVTQFSKNSPVNRKL